jgi:hypothetical protein
LARRRSPHLILTATRQKTMGQRASEVVDEVDARVKRAELN